MKKTMLGMAVATGLVVAMAGQSLATTAITLCDMNEAIAEAEVAIAEVGTMQYVWTDAKGVSISEHVAYLEKKIAMAEGAVASGIANDPEELYATVTEGTKALRLITGLAKKDAKQTAAPKATQTTRTTATQGTVKTVNVAAQTEQVANSGTVKTTEAKVQSEVKTSKAELAVAKIETKQVDAMASTRAKLTDVKVSTKVAGPEETTGVDEAADEMKVPATGEVEIYGVKTDELEKILMTIGIASAVGMLGLAGICMLIGRR